MSSIIELLVMNSLDFTDSGVIQDPKNFMEELQKVFEVMHVADIEHVELVSFKHRGNARI